VFQTSLDCGIVVGGHAPQEIVPAEIDLIRVPDIGVVPAKSPRDPIVGSLDERAEIVGDPSAGKKAHLLHGEIIVWSEMGSGAALLPDLGTGIGRLEHDREGRSLPVTTTQRVTAELEAAAERGQLQKGGMTSRARLPGLTGVEGERDGTPRRQADYQHRGDRRRAEENSHQ
jgi:hypothetical protein